MSYLALSTPIFTILCIAVIHRYAWKKQPITLRKQYFVTLILSLGALLLCPIIDGEDKFGWIQLYACYQILFDLDFYTHKSDAIFRILAFVIPVSHHILAIALGWYITNRSYKNEPNQ